MPSDAFSSLPDVDFEILFLHTSRPDAIDQNSVVAGTFGGVVGASQFDFRVLVGQGLVPLVAKDLPQDFANSVPERVTKARLVIEQEQAARLAVEV